QYTMNPPAVGGVPTAAQLSGATAGAIKTLLCPSRRTTVVGPKTDYATAAQCGMAILTPGTTTARWCNSILGSSATILSKQQLNPAPSTQGTFGGTTMGAVTAADGTANTILLSH